MATTYNTSNSQVSFTGSYGIPVTIRIYEYAPLIWNGLKNFIGNDIGVAGLIGNFYAESNLVPFIKQGNVPVGQTSIDYSKNVVSGAISEHDFVHAGSGYGLAQWTYYTRRQTLYNLWKSGNYDSIGNTDLGIAHVKFELEGGYIGTLNVLKTATDIRTASDYALHNYEQPADQGETSQKLRATYGEYFYSIYAGGAPQPPTPPPSTDDSVTVNPNTINTSLGSFFTISANVITSKSNTSIIWTHSDNINVVSELETIFNGVMISGYNGWVTANLVDENNNFLYSDSCTITAQDVAGNSKWFLYQRNLFYKLFS